jgi:ribulose-5-phosphate 4-epimerase/fuculose-1-phosphate aldolase
VPTGEGILQFQAAHHTAPLPAPARAALPRLLPVRRRLFARGWLGQDPRRYEGLGFGNVSARVPTPATPAAFVVSAVQTSGLAEPEPDDFALVTCWDAAAFRIESTGPRLPSSESPSHATLYALDPTIRCVLHVHAPELWRLAPTRSLPRTPRHAGYGSAALATALADLWRTGAPRSGCVLMGGHEDGVLAFGATPEEAESRLLKLG